MGETGFGIKSEGGRGRTLFGGVVGEINEDEEGAGEEDEVAESDLNLLSFLMVGVGGGDSAVRGTMG